MLKVLYNIKENGSLTPQLARINPGDVIDLSAPGGTFVGTKEPAVWIATGTGIAPFCSMLRSGLAGNKILVHGERRTEQYCFYEE